MFRSRVIKLVLLTAFFSFLIAGSANLTNDYCYAELVVPTCRIKEMVCVAQYYVYIDCPYEGLPCVMWLAEEYFGPVSPCEDKDCEEYYIPELPDELIIPRPWPLPDITIPVWLNRFIQNGNMYCHGPSVDLDLFNDEDCTDLRYSYATSESWKDMFCSYCPNGIIWTHFLAVFNPRNTPGYLPPGSFNNDLYISNCWPFCGGNKGAWFLPKQYGQCPSS